MMGEPRTAAKIREQVAEAVHNAWAHWMKYLLPRVDCAFGDRARWMRQSSTPYQQLCDFEKDGNREVADKFFAFLYDSDPTDWREQAEEGAKVIRQLRDILTDSDVRVESRSIPTDVAFRGATERADKFLARCEKTAKEQPAGAGE